MPPKRTASNSAGARSAAAAAPAASAAKARSAASPAPAANASKARSAAAAPAASAAKARSAASPAPAASAAKARPAASPPAAAAAPGRPGSNPPKAKAAAKPDPQAEARRRQAEEEERRRVEEEAERRRDEEEAEAARLVAEEEARRQAEEEAARLAEEEAARLVAEEEARAELARLKALANGEVTIKYSMYSEKFQITNHRLTAADIDDLYALTFVMPGCFIHLAEREFVHLEEHTYLKEDPPGTFHGLMAGETYWCYVQQDPEQERRDQERMRQVWAGGVESGIGDRGAEREGCSCGYGAPCTDPVICKDWDNRFANAIKAGGNPILFK